MTFLISEDDALKKLLKGMTVIDQKSATTPETVRNVGVWFGQPDQEVISQSYPYITIDMIDIAEDYSRSMRGKVKPSYLSDPTDMATNLPYDSDIHNWEINWPIPVNIDYQITTYARSPRHDRSILSQLLYTKIPMRFAVLEVDNNDANGTLRRLDVLDVSKRDITEQGKRLFVNAITVRVSSEIAPETYTKLYKTLSVSVTGPVGNDSFTPIDPFTTSAP